MNTLWRRTVLMTKFLSRCGVRVRGTSGLSPSYFPPSQYPDDVYTFKPNKAPIVQMTSSLGGLDWAAIMPPHVPPAPGSMNIAVLPPPTTTVQPPMSPGARRNENRSTPVYKLQVCSSCRRRVIPKLKSLLSSLAS